MTGKLTIYWECYITSNVTPCLIVPSALPSSIKLTTDQLNILMNPGATENPPTDMSLKISFFHQSVQRHKDQSSRRL